MSDEYKTEKERIKAEIEHSDGKPQNKDERFVNISFILSVAGIITIGACPLLGGFGAVSSLVMKLHAESLL